MKSTYLLVSVLAALTLSACGKDCHSPSSVSVTQTVVGTTSSDGIQDIVNLQNAERQALGQAPLTQGLTCYLYTVPTSASAIVGASLTSVGQFLYNGQFNVANSSVSTGFPILPAALENMYKTWFIVKCYGTLVVADNNYHEFDLTSDDGANLYIDGLLINNDGLHSVQTKSASKFLGYGVHSFELDFFQGQGMQALILNEDGQLMSNAALYH